MASNGYDANSGAKISFLGKYYDFVLITEF